MCAVRFVFRLNIFSQRSHLYGLSPVWRCVCSFKLCNWLNPRPQYVQTYALHFKWIFLWEFKFPVVENVWPHSSQDTRSVFSFELCWVIMWFRSDEKLPSVLLHISQKHFDLGRWSRNVAFAALFLILSVLFGLLSLSFGSQFFDRMEFVICSFGFLGFLRFVSFLIVNSITSGKGITSMWSLKSNVFFPVSESTSSLLIVISLSSSRSNWTLSSFSIRWASLSHSMDAWISYQSLFMRINSLLQPKQVLLLKWVAVCFLRSSCVSKTFVQYSQSNKWPLIEKNKRLICCCVLYLLCVLYYLIIPFSSFFISLIQFYVFNYSIQIIIWHL